jgi:hypothetical protein
MRRPHLVDIVLNPNAPSYGARIANDEEQTAAPSTLPAATEHLIAWAGSYWEEADPDEFEWNLGRRGMQARHIETGVMYRLRLGMPMGGEYQSGVSKFCIRDGRLILLADKPDRATTTHLGTFRAEVLKADEPWAPPTDQTDLRIY